MIIPDVPAAFAEIASCLAFLAWMRQGKSLLWSMLGVASITLFAWSLTRIEAAFLWRTYDGIFLASLIAWMWMVEGSRPNRWVVTGAAFCVVEILVITLGPRN